MRYKNVEFRRAGVADSNGYTIETSSERPAEIVAWQTSSNGKESCYTLCWIKEDKEGWYIETVGNRFTEYEDSEALMHVAKYALRSLNLEKEFRENE
tara:strand:- start:63542 stop:63832 length:291 start_codon:yes stop_codon:yes gene_type:complete